VRCSCCTPRKRQTGAVRIGACPRALRAQVNSVHVHPVDGNLLLTGSNDWTARLTDLRRLTSAASGPDAGAPGFRCSLGSTPQNACCSPAQCGSLTAGSCACRLKHSRLASLAGLGGHTEDAFPGTQLAILQVLNAHAQHGMPGQSSDSARAWHDPDSSFRLSPRAAAGRKPGSAHPAQLAELAHSKVVNAAYFSPLTGGKIMTTCIGARPPTLPPTRRNSQAAVQHSMTAQRCGDKIVTTCIGARPAWRDGQAAVQHSEIAQRCGGGVRAAAWAACPSPRQWAGRVHQEANDMYLARAFS